MVNSNPIFGLIPLSMAVKRWPDDYRPISAASLRLLHAGSYVKVIATAVGHAKKHEAIWLIIRQMSPLKIIGKHVGEVRPVQTRDGRREPIMLTCYHGLEEGMLIYFQLPDVIDMQLNRTETS